MSEFEKRLTEELQLLNLAVAITVVRRKGQSVPDSLKSKIDKSQSTSQMIEFISRSVAQTQIDSTKEKSVVPKQKDDQQIVNPLDAGEPTMHRDYLDPKPSDAEKSVVSKPDESKPKQPIGEQRIEISAETPRLGRPETPTDHETPDRVKPTVTTPMHESEALADSIDSPINEIQKADTAQGSGYRVIILLVIFIGLLGFWLVLNFSKTQEAVASAYQALKSVLGF